MSGCPFLSRVRSCLLSEKFFHLSENRFPRFVSLQENKASKNLIDHLKDQIGDKDKKVTELEEIQNTIINMMQATKKKKTG